MHHPRYKTPLKATLAYEMIKIYGKHEIWEICSGAKNEEKALILQKQEIYANNIHYHIIQTKFMEKMIEHQLVCIEWQNPPIKPLNSPDLSLNCL